VHPDAVGFNEAMRNAHWLVHACHCRWWQRETCTAHVLKHNKRSPLQAILLRRMSPPWLCKNAKDRNGVRITFFSSLILVERACEVDGQDSHGRMTSIAIKRLGVFTQPRPNADAAD
jgi:hypothetical protein